MSKTIWLMLIFIVGLAAAGCQSQTKIHPVYFVERGEAFPVGNASPNPLTLVVEIREDGKLSLNKIETGTIADTALLCEKFRAVFADREKTAVKEREVVIERQGKVSDEDLEKLIESLASVKASPIRVVKSES